MRRRSSSASGPDSSSWATNLSNTYSNCSASPSRCRLGFMITSAKSPPWLRSSHSAKHCHLLPIVFLSIRLRPFIQAESLGAIFIRPLLDLAPGRPVHAQATETHVAVIDQPMHLFDWVGISRKRPQTSDFQCPAIELGSGAQGRGYQLPIASGVLPSVWTVFARTKWVRSFRFYGHTLDVTSVKTAPLIPPNPS